MLEQQKFPLLLARIVELLRRDPGAVDDYKAALRSLVALSNERSISLRLQDGALSLEGRAVPLDVPFLVILHAQMTAHRIAEIQVAHHASAMDLMYLARALAVEEGRYAVGDGVAEQLRAAKATSVWVVTVEGDQVAEARRNARVSDVLTHLGVGRGGRPAAPPLDPAASGIIPATAGAAFFQLEERVRAAGTPLATVVQRLRSAPTGPGLSEALAAVGVGVDERIRSGRLDEAVQAIVSVIQIEPAITDSMARSDYAIGIRRLFSAENLRTLSRLLLDPLYGRDVMLIMVRAGAAGTEQLLDLLIKAPTIAERRGLLEALRGIKQGTDIVVGMLDHPEWFVVRNVADLVGELRIEEGVEPLGRALDHQDARVRRSAAVALARIGTPTAARHLGKALRDADDQIRLDVAKAIAGKGLAGLAMPIVRVADAEPDAAVKAELYRALGRIGTPEAVAALKKAAEPGGRIVGRRPAAQRVAAIEGLILAGGDGARSVLRELAADNDRDVRVAALKGLDAAPTVV